MLQANRIVMLNKITLNNIFQFKIANALANAYSQPYSQYFNNGSLSYSLPYPCVLILKYSSQFIINYPQPKKREDICYRPFPVKIIMEFNLDSILIVILVLQIFIFPQKISTSNYIQVEQIHSILEKIGKTSQYYPWKSKSKEKKIINPCREPKP